jgi:cephalosporin-C deacetylase-like acetyl esterase
MPGDNLLDTMSYSMRAYRANKPALAFDSKTPEEARSWQRKLRRKLISLLGGFPRERVPLSPRSYGTEEFDGYTREKVIFRSRRGMSVFAYMLLPKPLPTEPIPAVLCLHGHGRGVDDIVGIEEDGSMRKGYGGYQNDFALQCVDHGYAALAIEQFGFGHRRDEKARASGTGGSSCQPTSGTALLLGETMIGWRVYDGIRALDYLQTREEIDSTRLADMGISGGGTTSFYLAAVDQRVKAAVISGYFNTYKDSIVSVSHCMDNYIPGILKYAEMYDIAGLIAPRALFAESGTKDNIFPYRATQLAVRKARVIYGVFGYRNRIGLEVFEGEHQFYGRGAFEFLAKWL